MCKELVLWIYRGILHGVKSTVLSGVLCGWEQHWAAELRTAVMLPVAATVIYMLRVIFLSAQFVPAGAALGLGLTRT